MRAAALTLIFAALVPPEAIKEPPRVVKSEAKLTGTWSVVSAVRNGERIGPEKLRSILVTIDATSMTILDTDRIEKAAYKQTGSGAVKKLDFQPELASQDYIVKGIYDLNGDLLRIAWARNGTARPLTFEINEARPDEMARLTLLVLKRKK